MRGWGGGEDRDDYGFISSTVVRKIKQKSLAIFLPVQDIIAGVAVMYVEKLQDLSKLSMKDRDSSGTILVLIPALSQRRDLDVLRLNRY